METTAPEQYHIIWRNPFTDDVIKDEWYVISGESDQPVFEELLEYAKAETSLIHTDGFVVEFWKLEKQVSLQRQ